LFKITECRRLNLSYYLSQLLLVLGLKNLISVNFQIYYFFLIIQLFEHTAFITSTINLYFFGLLTTHHINNKIIKINF